MTKNLLDLTQSTNINHNNNNNNNLNPHAYVLFNTYNNIIWSKQYACMYHTVYEYHQYILMIWYFFHSIWYITCILQY